MMNEQTIIRMLDEAKSERQTWESHWQEIDDIVLPKRANFTVKRTKGEKRTRKQYDSTAQWSNEQLANGLHGSLMSPSTRWFFLKQRRNNISRSSIKWLQTVEDLHYDVFNDPKTNFHAQVHELLIDIGAHGTGVFQIVKNGLGGIVFNTRHLGECYLFENSRGVIDGIIREFEYNTRQLVERWPQDLPKEIFEELREGKTKSYKVLHAVLPREFFDSRKLDKKNMPWMSKYILLKTKTTLQEGGFRSFPFPCPRWTKRTGEIYGNSQAMTALPDIKMANEMKRTIIRAAHKVVGPALQVPDNGFIGPIKSAPESINFYRSGSKDRIEPLDTGSRLDIGMDLLQSVQRDIQRSFYVDAFLMTDDSDGVNVKAEFVRQRREERFRSLAPMLARFSNEFLDPTIMRTYDLLTDMNEIPPAPDELVDDNQISIGYVSPITRAQRTEDGENLLRLMQLIAPIGEIDPSVWHNFNGDEIVRIAANDLYNIPIDMLRSREEVEQARQQQQQRDQINQLIEQGQGAASGLKDVATARKNAGP